MLSRRAGVIRRSCLEWLSLIGAALRVGDELRAKRPGLRLVLPQ